MNQTNQINQAGQKIRSFIAIELSEELKAGLEEIQKKLRRSDADVKWVRPEGIHLTLKFLGSVTPEELERVSRAVEPAVAGVKPFELTLKSLGCFPSTRSPRVIWVGVDGGGEEVCCLQRIVEGQAAAAGFPPEERAFQPHLTVGRVRSSRGKAALARLVEENQGVNLGSLRADAVHLFRSDLRPSGAVYTKMKTFPMKGKSKDVHHRGTEITE